MKTTRKLHGLFFTSILAVLLAHQPMLAQKDNIPSTTVETKIDLTKQGPKIDDLLYGHFIENLSNWFEGGLWSEMIGDRKFFYAVDNSDTLKPINKRSNILGRWRPLGPESAVVKETKNTYVGDHTPRVRVDVRSKQGIQQSGLPLVKGKTYESRVVLAASTSLAGTPGPTVEVSLVWGPKPTDRQSFVVDKLTSCYEKYNFSFTAQLDSKDGRIEITGTGTGSFLIGAVSLMPSDNIEGFRPDLIELMRQMRVTMFRWGGNFSSGYEWRDGIGDRDQRAPRYDIAWTVVEQNDIGTFEFLTLCRLVGAEPNIGVNSGFGDAYSAGQWVEYVNGAKDTPMGSLRGKHGHPEPFNVKWWGIGNEMYGQWQIGHMELEHYVVKHNQFAMRMRKVDPSIILVASGATPYEMNTVLRHFYDVPKRPIAYGSRYDWSGGLLQHSASNFNYIAEHIYPLPDEFFDVEKQEFVKLEDPLVNEVRRPANRVKGAVEAWKIYEQRMPWLKSSDIKIVLDEWVSGKRGFHGALGTATVLNEIFRHTDLFKMSAYTCAPCALTYNGTESGFRGIGLVFKLYANNFGTIPVQVNGNNPQKEVKGVVGVDKPEKTSGSDTYPLDVVAAVSEDGKTLTVSVVNATYSAQKLKLSLIGGALPAQATQWTISAPNVDAENKAGESFPIVLKETSLSNINGELTLAPITVNLYSFKLK